MIKNLFIINFTALLSGILRLRHKKAGLGKKIMLILLVAFVIVSLMMSFGSLFYILYDPIFDAGIGWFYFALQAVMSFVLSVFGTVFSAQTLFKAKDNELLLSMPIKPLEILVSRLLVLIAFEYVFESLIVVPAFLIWVAGGRATVPGVVFCLTGYALLPLISLTVACLTAWALSSILTRFKRTNMITLVLSITIFAIYMRLYWQLQSYLNALLDRGVEIAEAFRRAMPPFYAFGAGIANHSVIDMFIFALWAITPAVVMVVVMSVNYQKILTANRGMVKTVYKEKAAKVSGACFALIKKELAHYAAKPMVILNTSIVSVFMVIGAAVIIIRRESIEFLNSLSSMLDNMPLPVMAAAILTFMCSMNNLSASLISLEGKNLWLAKSIPVHPRVLFLSKICTHMITSGVPCFLASVSISFLLAKSLTDCFLIVILPQTINLFIAAAGLYINLLFPRFDWTSEIQPVKQGASAMITIFGSMVLVMGLFMLYISVFSRYIGATAYAWILAAVLAAGAFMIYLRLSATGAKRLMEL